jgi:hypothetical protein
LKQTNLYKIEKYIYTNKGKNLQIQDIVASNNNLPAKPTLKFEKKKTKNHGKKTSIDITPSLGEII